MKYPLHSRQDFLSTLSQLNECCIFPEKFTLAEEVINTGKNRQLYLIYYIEYDGFEIYSDVDKRENYAWLQVEDSEVESTLKNNQILPVE